METLTKTDTNVFIQAQDLAQLFTGVLPFTGGKDDPIVLNSVLIVANSRTLSATATDRYRLTSGSIELEQTAEFKALVSAADIKRMLDLIKPIKAGAITLAFNNDNLELRTHLGQIACQLVDATFPPFEHLFQFPAAADPITQISFNPSFFADYAKITGKRGGVLIKFHATNKAMEIAFNGRLALDRVTWRCLLMPMKVA